MYVVVVAVAVVADDGVVGVFIVYVGDRGVVVVYVAGVVALSVLVVFGGGVYVVVVCVIVVANGVVVGGVVGVCTDAIAMLLSYCGVGGGVVVNVCMYTKHVIVRPIACKYESVRSTSIRIVVVVAILSYTLSHRAHTKHLTLDAYRFTRFVFVGIVVTANAFSVVAVTVTDAVVHVRLTCIRLAVLVVRCCTPIVWCHLVGSNMLGLTTTDDENTGVVNGVVSEVACSIH